MIGKELKKVLDAEKKAKRKIQASKRKAAKIVDFARKEAEELKERAKEETKRENEKTLTDARRRGEAETKRILSEAKTRGAELERMAKRNEREAITLIVKRVVGGK